MEATTDLARLRSALSEATRVVIERDHTYPAYPDTPNSIIIVDTEETELDPQTVLALLDAAEASERLRVALISHTGPFPGPAADNLIHAIEHGRWHEYERETADDWRTRIARIQEQAVAHVVALATPPPATVDEEAVADAAIEVFIDAMQEPSR
jgi:hypothetical protein